MQAGFSCWDKNLEKLRQADRMILQGHLKQSPRHAYEGRRGCLDAESSSGGARAGAKGDPTLSKTRWSQDCTGIGARGILM